MLRWTIGDDAFFGGIKNYYSDTKIANGFARSNDLIRNFELVADTTLTTFFSNWLYGEGYPTDSVNYSQSTAENLTLELSQSTSHQSVYFSKCLSP